MFWVFSPKSQAGEPEPDFPQHTQTIDGVEDILEVQAEENLVRLAGRALVPLAGNVDGSFGPQRDGDPDLQRMEVIPCQVFHCVTQAFGDKASQGFVIAIGRTSASPFGRAWRVAPPRSGARSKGTCPAAKR